MLNQGALTVKVHTQLRSDLRNRESKRATRKHPSIHATLIIRVMDVTAENQIRDSYVYQGTV